MRGRNSGQSSRRRRRNVGNKSVGLRGNARKTTAAFKIRTVAKRPRHRKPISNPRVTRPARKLILSIAATLDLHAQVVEEANTAALLVRIQSRDMLAFEQLYGVFALRLKRYVKRFVRNDQCAEDVVHDVFLRIWRYAASFDALKVGRPDAWIFQIARNQAITQAVLTSRSISIDSFDTEDGQPAIEGLADESEDGSITDQIVTKSAAFERAIYLLPPNYRQAIYLRYQRELTHQQIAAILGIPVGTVKTWLRRALLQLRKCLHVRLKTPDAEELQV